MTAADPQISVIVPFLDEAGTLAALHERVVAAIEATGHSFEILFVDDGSGDGGSEIVDRLVSEDSRVRVIHFRRNFGKAAALDAGFARARGRIVFTMDADLQDDPAEIENFLARLDEGYDVVSGWKKNRRDPLGKRLPSLVFNTVVRSLSGVHLRDMNCGFKAYRAEALQGLRLYGELHRYIPVLVAARGFRVGELAVLHHARTSGRSKYGLERMPKGFFDLLTVMLLTRFRTRPLHLFGGVGLVLASLGFAALAYLTVLWFMGLGPIGTRPLLFLGLLLMVVGVQLISTGLLGEMMAQHNASQGESYVIRAEHQQLREVPDEEPADAPGDRPLHDPDRGPAPGAGA